MGAKKISYIGKIKGMGENDNQGILEWSPYFELGLSMQRVAHAQGLGFSTQEQAIVVSYYFCKLCLGGHSTYHVFTCVNSVPGSVNK